MSYALSTCSSQSFNGEYDQYVNVAGCTMLRTIDPSILTSWTEIWLGIRYRVGSLITKTDLTPYSLPVGSTTSYMHFHLGLQSGLTTSPKKDASSLPHFIGMKGWLEATSPQVLNESAGGNLYLEDGIFPTHIKSGVESNGSSLQYNYHNVDEFRGVKILRFIKGSPNWTIKVLHTNSTTDIATDKDFTVTDLNDQFLTFTTWADVVSYFSTYGYKESNLYSSVAIDEGTYGSLNVISFGWDPRYWPLKCSDIFGVVKTS